MSQPERDFNWFDKARSRVWSRQANLHKIPAGALLAGTFFYTGLSPFASGTVGSFAAVALYLLIPGLQNPFALFIASLVVLVVGIWSGGVIERTLEVQDPGIVVIDEVLGQWIALLTLGYSGDIVYAALAFVFFRAFDIVKIWPARAFERMHGGAGIMLDDAAAGVYANIAAHIAMLGVLHFFPRA